MAVIVQNCFSWQGGIGAEKHTKGAFLAKCSKWVGEQDHRVIDFVQGALIAIDHISAALHRYRVKTAGGKRGGQIGGVKKGDPITARKFRNRLEALAFLRFFQPLSSHLPLARKCP